MLRRVCRDRSSGLQAKEFHFVSQVQLVHLLAPRGRLPCCACQQYYDTPRYIKISDAVYVTKQKLNLEYCITKNLVIYLGQLRSQHFEIGTDLIGWK